MTGQWSEQVVVEDKLAQLGEPSAEFAVRGWRLFRNLILAPFLIAAGLALEIVLVGFVRLHHHELLVLGIVLVLSGVMLVVRAFRNRGLRVLVFPEGLVRLQRGAAQAACWEEIDQVWQKSGGAHWTTRAWRGALTLSVRTVDGRQMTFDDSLPWLRKLANIVLRETLPYLWPRALAAYEAGTTLDFGKLRMSRRGLSRGKETLPWCDVQKVKYNGAQVLIYKKGKWTHWLNFTVSDIPNFHVLLALLEQRVPVEKSSK